MANDAVFCGRCGARVVINAPRPTPLLSIQGLTIRRPDREVLLSCVDLEVCEGEIVVLLGASGAGKSTLLHAINDAAGLKAKGFKLSSISMDVHAEIGVVPQRGALFDHLSVAGNLKLALRNATPPQAATTNEVRAWLQSLHLPAAWSRRGAHVAHVSGGEAQRLAVARTLAGGRRLLFLDEPSVGLDPFRVLVLARLLREVMQERRAGAVVITHDLMFAAAFADRFLYMDRDTHRIVELNVGVVPRDAERSHDDRERIERLLGRTLVGKLANERPATAAGSRMRPLRAIRSAIRDAGAPFALVPRVLAATPRALFGRVRDFFEVVGVVLKQTLVRPAPFFAIVSTLIGFSVLYIFHRSFTGGDMPLRDAKVFELIGARHIIALVPPMAGILYTATSGNAITAWLGGISLTRQSEALRALGVSESRYLWVPAAIGLVLSFLFLAALFAAGMIAGGAFYVLGVDGVASGWPDALDIVTAQIVDPRTHERPLLVRALVLLGIYSFGITADTIAKGAKGKSRSEDVTVAMVRNVIACTLWIVVLELLSLPFVLR